MATQIISRVNGTNLVRQSLRWNGIVEAVLGLDLIVAAGLLPGFLGVGTPALAIGCGVALLAAATAYLWMSSRRTINLKLAAAIAIFNVLGAVAIAIVLLMGVLSLTTEGKLAFGLLAAMWAVFGTLEFLGVQQAKRVTSNE